MLDRVAVDRTIARSGINRRRKHLLVIGKSEEDSNRKGRQSVGQTKAARTPVRAVIQFTLEHRLHVVIEEKLVWMRAKAKSIMFFTLGRGPYFDEIFREHVTLKEEIAFQHSGIRSLEFT